MKMLQEVQPTPDGARFSHAVKLSEPLPSDPTTRAIMAAQRYRHYDRARRPKEEDITDPDIIVSNLINGILTKTDTSHEDSAQRASIALYQYLETALTDPVIRPAHPDLLFQWVTARKDLDILEIRHANNNTDLNRILLEITLGNERAILLELQELLTKSSSTTRAEASRRSSI